MAREDFDQPAWAEDGMEIWIPWNREKGSVLRCLVATAAGNSVRVVNEKYGVNKWMWLDDTYVKKESPQAWNNQSEIMAEIVKLCFGTV